jgi:nicotinate phosphoribosyltransferase
LEAQGKGRPIRAVRIDSGDLASQARAVRAIFDREGCRDIQIALSGGFDEYLVDELLRAGAPVDAFGVGTSLDVSVDAPSLDMAYKLQEYAGKPRRKRSPGKATWPGTKQVFRERGAGGQLIRDSIALAAEKVAGEPLLREVIRNGRRTTPAPALAEIRDFCSRELRALPPSVRELADADPTAPPFPVLISDALRELAARVDAEADRPF